MSSFEPEDPVMPYDPDHDAPHSPALATKERHEDALLKIRGVEGVGLTVTAAGDEAIVVYVRASEVHRRLPKTLDGMAVIIETTGPIEAT